ncbi:hypothetical protein [Gehongia tenuis]|uniref:Uncharacterized protein n=1 Tax=Gehongia tenuis TaxID=2763655 RepID=A0A926D5M4_9FIRM|nr:hypothetical protein [Gehongia tenuis]MBC8531808.1 hypothetical protein [Gehongia tenuis]
MNATKILDAAGLPYVQGAWKNAPKLPYIAYLMPSTTNIAADSKVAEVVAPLRIELYTERIDKEAENKIVAALEGYVWDKSDTIYLDGEDMYVTYYEVED